MWYDQVANTRKMIELQMKSSKDKFFQSRAKKGLQVRLTRESSQKLISDRKNEEIRVKTARAGRIRRKIVFGNQSSRATLLERNMSAANLIRATSPRRVQRQSLNFL